MRALPLSEHLRQAEYAWQRIASALADGSPPFVSETRDALRESAAKTFWLYPLVEGRWGLPAA